MNPSLFQLPVTEPVIVFGIVLFVILAIPMLFSRLRIPEIIGLILSGMILGPLGFNILASKGSIELLGTVGLMYLMFLAGLELDIHTFAKSRNKSIVFGALTFIVPLVIGYIVCLWVLGLNQIASLLIASMFSTHTLISYPIISRFRITKIEPVGVAIGGTIITDTLVLLLLVVITALAKGNLTFGFWVLLTLKTLIYLGFIIYVFPLIGKWFFRNITGEPIAQYIFVITMVFFAGSLARLAGIEPIIGAFLAGIAFNRQIPHSSTLMNRIEFIGNSLFIPFFLIFVGMFINLRVFVSGWESIKEAIILISVALLTKWLAAYITQKIFHYKPVYRNLIFGLSSSHAAATIAVILIGYQMGIIDTNILNATIILILVTCLVSSFVTENASRQIVVIEKPQEQVAENRERMLVPISNPSTIDDLLEFANYLKTHHSQDPIYTLMVVKDEEEVAISKSIMNRAIEIGSAAEYKVETATRVDINVASGIIRACKELIITDVVMGWNGNISPKQWIFGTMLENVLSEIRQPIYVVGIKHPLNTITQINALVPSFAEYENGFTHWIKALKNLTLQTNSKLKFIVEKNSADNFKSAVDKCKLKMNFTIDKVNVWDDFFKTSTGLPNNNLLFLLSAREGSISYSQKLDSIPKYISNQFKGKSFVIVYPPQAKLTSVDLRSFLTGSGQLAVEESPTIIEKVK
ncbi:MAG: cation:proton antiporter [Bacteroidales bacterium]|nr:cation:proton antiporter [Bacteroidales bacterium]